VFLNIKLFFVYETGSACNVPMDLVISIDASGSVGSSNFKQCLDFVQDIVSTLDIDSGDVRVGIFTYSSETNVNFHLNTYNKQSDVMAAIAEIVYTRGGTYIGRAIEKLRELFDQTHGDRPDVDNVAFVMTDGKSKDDTSSAAEAARSDGITIYAFGIGNGASVSDLEDIASKPIEKYLYMVNSFSDLNGFGGVLFANICRGILIL